MDLTPLAWSWDLADGFSDFGYGVWHCNRCHRLVRIDGFGDDDAAVLAILLAHAEVDRL